MTTFEKRINEDLKNAMKAKEKTKLQAIRSIKTEILKANTDGSGEELTEEKAIKILTKMAKQRKDSLKIYEEQGREDLAKVERDELVVIEEYLPKALSPEEIEAGVKEVIEQVGASSMKDMGKVMGITSKKFMGRADGKVISAVVKRLLSGK